MATFFEGMFFKISISFSLKIKQKLSCSIFKSLDHSMMFLVVLITFEPILVGFLRFSTNTEMIDDGPHSEMVTHLLCHVTS